MNAVIYKTIDQDFIKKWETLWKESVSANYVNSPKWFLSVLETFEYKDFAIVAVYNKEMLVAVAALVKEKKYGISCYTIAPGDFACAFPFLFDLANKEIARVLIEKLLELGNIFVGNIAEKYLSYFTQKYLSTEAIPFSINYHFTLKKDENNNVLISNRKKLLHEARNITEKLSFTVFDGTEKKGLDAVFQIDLQSRKQTRGYSTFADEKIQAFYKELAKEFKKDLLIGILYLENKPVAYGTGFLINNNFYYNQMAYLAEYRQFSPGKVLLVKLIDYLHTRNAQTFDFGSGDSFIKKLVTEETDTLYQIIMTKNKLILRYIVSLYTLRRSAFEQLSKNKKGYKLYREIKKKFVS